MITILYSNSSIYKYNLELYLDFVRSLYSIEGVEVVCNEAI